MQQAVAMATIFTMLLAAGVTSFGTEPIHQHPAYTSKEKKLEIVAQLTEPQPGPLMLAAPPQGQE